MEQPLKKLFVATNDASKEETKEQKEIRHMRENMRDINPTISIILLNVNELSTPIKRQTLPCFREKGKSNYMLSAGDTLQTKEGNRMKANNGRWCAVQTVTRRARSCETRTQSRHLVSLEVKRAGYDG